jgi:hypothetical protein
MAANGEIIAIVLSDGIKSRLDRLSCKGAQRLIRAPDGKVILEDVESQEEFERAARTTGCFRRGKAIRDPRTREVMGYEMEQVQLA